jgi:hypothetical protein
MAMCHKLFFISGEISIADHAARHSLTPVFAATAPPPAQ